MADYQGFAQYYDDMMWDVNYDKWFAYLDGLIHDNGGAASILDCACGTCELTRRFKMAGYEVSGFDLSKDMLTQAQAKLRSMGLSIPLFCMDLRDFSVHHGVDALCCGCDGINYLKELSDVERFFDRAYSALKPNGLLLFDVSSRYKLEKIIGEGCFSDVSEDYAYIWQNRLNKRRHVVTMELCFFVSEGERYRRFDETHVQRAHSVKELCLTLHEHGFSDIKTYEAFTMDEPGNKSERIQFVCRRR